MPCGSDPINCARAGGSRHSSESPRAASVLRGAVQCSSVWWRPLPSRRGGSPHRQSRRLGRQPKTTAELVLGDPSRQTSGSLVAVPRINFADSASQGRFSGDSPFPGQAFVDVDGFVVEVAGAVEIPEAGPWTFGVHSDDGFPLQVGDFTAACDCQRPPGDPFATFSFQSAGGYPLRLIFFEWGCGAALELAAAKGSGATWDATAMRWVGDSGDLRARLCCRWRWCRCCAWTLQGLPSGCSRSLRRWPRSWWGHLRRHGSSRNAVGLRR
jgi:hypothetical protein